MKDSIHKYFQIGTIQWMSYPRREILDSLRTIASDDFFDAVEICGFVSEAQRIQAKKILDQSHLKVCFAAQPVLLNSKLNPNDLNEEKRFQAEDLLLKAVDEADFFGADGISFLAGKWDASSRDSAYEQLIKTTRNVCTYAGEKGMTVELEVFDFDMDKAVLIGPAPYAAEFASDMNSFVDNFGLLVDLSHFPTTYETSAFVIKTLRPFITHLHIGNAVVKKDCDAYGDQHPRFGYPESANDVPELLDFFQVLKQEAFFNAEKPYVLSFEVKPREDEDEDVILANTKRVIRRAWSLLED